MAFPKHMIALGAGIAFSFALVAGSQAQEFPSGPITIVVPFSASGSAPNVLARNLADRLQAEWGQPVVVENRPGAAGQIAAQYVAGHAADGHTLMMGSVATHVLGSAMRDEMQVDTLTAFEPISQFGYTPMLISANAELGVSSLEELVEHAQENPGTVTYMSVGVGSAAHLAAELLQSVTGIEMIHVPYEGVSQATLDLVSGEVNVGFSNIINMVQFIEEGQVVPLAVTDVDRSTVLPDTPAIAETHPDATVELWWGLFAPAGTPAEVVEALSAEVNEMVSEPELVEEFASGGATLKGTTPEGLQELMMADYEKWSRIIEEAGI
tara:strand:+ start:1156 stop:2127 length:972 start_codon:yes stop_codon:yes gene_type:complete